MKVLQLGKFYPPAIGGIESVMFDITEGLNESGVKCDVLCSNDSSSSLFEINERLGYKIYRVASLGRLASTSMAPLLVYLAHKMRKDYDIIHVHLPDPMANLAAFLAMPHSKIILHWHSDIIKQKKMLFFYKPLLLWLMRKADVIIATSKIYAENSDLLIKFKGKVKIIPIGIADPLIPQTTPEIYDRFFSKRANDRIVFSLGRMSYYKGFSYLIQAAYFLPENYKIVIGGQGDLLEEYKSEVLKRNLENKVFLIGSIPHEKLHDYYHGCDVFCLPSIEKSEAFGVVLPEAMAFSKPVVATNIIGSGVSWVNQHGVSGLNAEPKNPEAIAKAIIDVTSNDYIYRRYSHAARLRYEKLFTKEKMVSDIINLYNSVLA